MMTRMFTAAGALVDQIRINELARIPHAGRWYWFKKRRGWARPVIAVANGFFRVAGNPVVILGRPRDWIAWEQECLSLLHGDRFGSMLNENGAWGVEEFPGRSISDHLKDGTANREMAVAAGRELARAHGFACAALNGAWSHGDPHTGNFVYDVDAGQARLMDFEVRHHPWIEADRRHADDLLVFLQDTLGRLPRAEWLEWARSFVAAYQRPAITAHLLERLTAPRGVARVWWAVRTTYLESRELDRRLADLRASLVA